MLALAGDDARDVREVAAGRLFAKNMQAALQPGNGDLGSHVVRHAHEQGVERLLEELPILRMRSDAIAEAPRARKGAIAYRNGLEAGMLVDELPAPLADDAVSGDADAQDGRSVDARRRRNHGWAGSGVR